MNKHKQRGIGLIGLLAVAAIVGLVAVTGMQLVPSFIEFQAIKRAVARAASGSTPAEVRDLFSKQAMVDDFTAVTARDLEITKDAGGNVVVAFSYEKKLPLFGPVSLLIDYAGSSSSR
ncbi:DUF4845 domain-containing protein [Derxia lacustris]|uniref:DUF4845 domain-containing protein n=1 Tax=Derxia lacustris TaxID=764842 RepID=UPI000A17824C|nr:DUF4845 domain-containing protein [Derxia lacustris]